VRRRHPSLSASSSPGAFVYQLTAAAASDTINITERAGRAAALLIVSHYVTGFGARQFEHGLPLAEPTHSQQSNTDQQMSFRNRWSSSTSSRIASGSWSRCHRHSSRPALSPSPSGAAARAALIA
jgi:hypothetical protein